MTRYSLSLPLLLLSGLLILAGCDSMAPEGETPANEQNPGTLTVPFGKGGVTQSYIVVFKDDVDDVRGTAQGMANGRAKHVYEHTIKGFAADFAPQAAAALANNPNVAYVTEDHPVTLAPPPGKGPGGGGGGSTGESVPYGITRVNGGVSGAGLRACVLDSGVDLDHPDLVVDQGASRTFITKGKDANDADDGNGHGTHVAGTIAAVDNEQGVIGVAAGATIVAIKVLDRRGSGSYSGVIAGVDYVASGAPNCDVANMSLGGPVSQALDDAVLNAAATGVVFTLAAGNESDDAQNHSPARAGGVSANDNVYAISAIDSNDRFASFSNYGAGVEYAAPGVGVTSTWKEGGYNTISGTSMAAPHAAGVFLLGAPRTDGTAQNDPDGNPDPIIVH